jgi:hypothetical protein
MPKQFLYNIYCSFAASSLHWSLIKLKANNWKIQLRWTPVKHRAESAKLGAPEAAETAENSTVTLDSQAAEN